jgi:hypothetical protein
MTGPFSLVDPGGNSEKDFINKLISDNAWEQFDIYFTTISNIVTIPLSLGVIYYHNIQPMITSFVHENVKDQNSWALKAFEFEENYLFGVVGFCLFTFVIMVSLTSVANLLMKISQIKKH